MGRFIHAATQHVPWNKGKLVGQKAPLRLRDIWAIRVRLQIGKRARELALFDLAIDSDWRQAAITIGRSPTTADGERGSAYGRLSSMVGVESAISPPWA